MNQLQGWLSAIFCAVILGLASFGADLIWYHWRVPHTTVNGLVHGALLFLVMGAVLGFAWKTPRSMRYAAVLSLLIGLIAAGSFYILYPLTGWIAMFLAWMLLWPLFAWLRRWVLQSTEPMSITILRGVSAAILSGLMFYLVRGIWTNPPEDGPEPIRFILSWTIAFLPGMLALLLNRKSA